MRIDTLSTYITVYPDFPKPGILFRDISPLLADQAAFPAAMIALAAKVQAIPFDSIVAIDARGFIIGGALALHLRKGLIQCRKPAKLPGELVTETYSYEYSANSLSLQKRAIKSGKRYVIVDDVLASGNTALAACRAVTALGGTVAGILCLMELTYLDGRALLAREANITSIESLIKVEQ